MITALIALSIALPSCHKDPGDNVPTLVQTMTIDGSNCPINCTYDDQNRVTSVTQCDTAETYTYYPDSVSYVKTVSGAVFYKYLYRLNASGIATGYRRIASDGSVTIYSLTYDAGGNRTRLTDSTHSNTFIDYVLQNGNAVYDSSLSSVTGAGNYTISRIFYANTENRIGNVNFGKAFLGSSSPNFKKAETYNTPDGLYTIKYTYELDYQNNVSRRIMKLNDSIIESRYYSYQ